MTGTIRRIVQIRKHPLVLLASILDKNLLFVQSSKSYWRLGAGSRTDVRNVGRGRMESMACLYPPPIAEFFLAIHMLCHSHTPITLRTSLASLDQMLGAGSSETVMEPINRRDAVPVSARSRWYCYPL